MSLSSSSDIVHVTARFNYTGIKFNCPSRCPPADFLWVECRQRLLNDKAKHAVPPLQLACKHFFHKAGNVAVHFTRSCHLHSLCFSS